MNITSHSKFEKPYLIYINQRNMCL